MFSILVVEDSLFQRNLITSALKGDVYSVDAVDSAKKALVMLDENPTKYSFIITDLLMPEMSGIEFLTELKNRGNSIPAIVLSADIQEPVKQECLGLGAKEFLQKPPKKEILLETVSKYLQ